MAIVNNSTKAMVKMPKTVKKKIYKCRILFNNLIPSIEERCMYSDLFLLKNMESLVKEMTWSKEVNLSIKEHLLTSATDMVECLRTDPFGAFLSVTSANPPPLQTLLCRPLLCELCPLRPYPLLPSPIVQVNDRRNPRLPSFPQQKSQIYFLFLV